MMSSTCIVRTAVVRKPGIVIIVSLVLVLVLVLVLRIWSCSHHWLCYQNLPTFPIALKYDVQMCRKLQLLRGKVPQTPCSASGPWIRIQGQSLGVGSGPRPPAVAHSISALRESNARLRHTSMVAVIWHKFARQRTIKKPQLHRDSVQWLWVLFLWSEQHLTA